MKNINRLFLILISIMLVFGPCCVYATNDGNNTTNNENETNTENTDPDNNPDEENKPTIEQKSISFGDEYKIKLSEGETKKLTVIVEPSDALIEWSSADTEIATVDQEGNVTAGTKGGTTKINATIKDTKITAACSVEVVASKNNDATLKSLSVNGTLSPEFKSDVTEYKVTLDKDVTSLDFDFELSDSNARAFLPSDSKNKDLKNGDVLTFKVVAEDEKTSQSYKFTIVKEANSLDLKSLFINGYALNEIFDSSVTQYTASIPYEIDTITVKTGTVATTNEVAVKISGITNLKVGANTVKVVVSDKTDSSKSKTYTIVVTREKEVSIEEKPTSIITSAIVDNNNSNSTPNSNNNISNANNSDNDDDFLKYAIVSLACLILFAIGGIGIYFYIKTSPKKLKKKIVEDKKDELSDAEVSIESIPKTQSNIESIMDEKLIETREFKKEDLQQTIDTNDLFNDKEDV